MNFISILVLCLVLAFTVYQGYLSIKTFIKMRKALEFIKNNKQNVVVIKDYKSFVIAYTVLSVFMALYTALYVFIKMYLLAGLFGVFTVFCIVFIVDSVANRTTAFYDGGFLSYGKMWKYKNVTAVEENSRILRGSEVKIVGATPIYVSKKSKEVLLERLEQFRNRHQKRR